ncbi:MAG: hypothetical protein HYT47_00175 [Candidatus Vogelbacteria bacterium]|nr:hypothetical protein [Candidatus Vogelbacteria bacterium]
MINLLLPVDQQKLRTDYRRRWLVVAGFLFLVWLLIILVILSSLYLLVRLRRAETVEALASVKNDLEALEIEKQAATIREANVLIKQLVGDTTTASPVAIIRRLVDRRGSVAISEISYNFSPVAPATFRLTGKSPTRQEFLLYLEALRRDPELATIDSPVKNLIREKNLVFTLEVTVKSLAPPR